MASVASNRRGFRRILFVARDGSRKTIRLGKMPLRTAEGIKLKVEALAAAAWAGGTADTEVLEWVATRDDILYGKLAAVGLVEPRGSLKLKPFLDGYIEGRCDVKPATATVLGHTRRNLIDHFGAEKPMRDITPGDADAWRLSLVSEKLADNTIRRRCGIAKQFFRAALRRKLIPSNPFSDLAAAVKANTSRMFFVTGDMAAKVLAACPDAQWRAIFALCRYGGLRCPSEVLGLRWGDIDWEHGKMLVHSPKTEHHDGKDTRLVPLFPELRQYLQECFDLAEPGTEYVVTRYRDKNANMRTQLERIIGKAGLKAWPKLFQNMRSTRETELAERWPEHVVCAWIGNSTAVARKHYLQVTEEHFERAAMDGAQAAQKAAQQQHEVTGSDRQAVLASNQESAEILGENGCLPITADNFGEEQKQGHGPYRTRTYNLTLVRRAL